MRVYNIKTDEIPEGAIYIGRPSIFGNPFVIGKNGTRKQVIEKFEIYLQETPSLLKKVKEELKGKDLICHCAPKACHGDVLMRYANEIILDFD